MITNEERREAAEIMRDGTRFSVSSCAVAPRLGLECEEFETCAECESKLAERLADLIEPEPERTCRAEIDYDAMEDGIPGYRIWRCSCGEPFLHFRGRVPSYCSECGKKVVE